MNQLPESRCDKCGRQADTAWPPGWMLHSEGFTCPACIVFLPRFCRFPARCAHPDCTCNPEGI